MSSPITAVPADNLHGAANQMRARAADFTSGGTGPNGSWPDQQAYDRWEEGYAQAHKDMSARLHKMADAVDKATNDFAVTDQGNAATIGKVDSGSVKDMMNAATTGVKDGITAASGAVSPLVSGLSGAAGSLGSGITGGIGAGVNAGMQAAQNAAKMNAPATNVATPGISGDVGASNAGEGGATSPAAAQTPLAPPPTAHGGRPVGAHGDRARTEQQQTDQQQVIPAAGVMPGGAAVPPSTASGTSPGKTRTVRIVTAHDREREQTDG